MCTGKNSLNLLLLASVFVTGCTGPGMYQIELLPAPYVYSEGLVDPFPKQSPKKSLPYNGILYATDRLPSNSKYEEIYYRNKRGYELRLGMGEIEIDKLSLAVKRDVSWEELVKVSKQKIRPEAYPIQVYNFREYGFLSSSIIFYPEKRETPERFHQAENEYANLINQKLAISKNQDIYLYVHGYNTIFEDPLLVGTELWHYMGYDGVFIAYSWPATPRGLAYLADMDTARITSRNLRLFLRYLSKKTRAKNIHIIGYSMGTRVVTYTLQDISLIFYKKTEEQIRNDFRIGNVILIGSDLERGVFASYLVDGLLRVPKSLTIYTSDTDSAMGASRWLFERYRLGESLRTGGLNQRTLDFLKPFENLRVIDVTLAENAATGNGHHYFIESPWVSSDILLTLMYDLPPDKRGLAFDKKNRSWFFTRDYHQRVSAAISELDPAVRGIN